MRKQVKGPVVGKIIKSKKGVTLTELVATIALLSILAGASVAVIGVVMQSFQINTDIMISRQEITQAQNLIHHTAEVAETVAAADISDAVPFSLNEGDRRLAITDGKLVMAQYSGGVWEDFLPFEGLSSAVFKLREDSGGSFLLSYKFKTEKALSYNGGVTLNNVTEGTPFTVHFETGGTEAPLPGESVYCIYFQMPKSNQENGSEDVSSFPFLSG